ncbi:Cysteine desulfurase [Rhodovulum sp. PH10]|uniref:cysteine desulfurase family protein n=1 Tax=Rhodovulum sp. PH10 TaxID=1187851 RepID=UPI00027C1EBD|nr:cysteine desulfurase family protein [Rhodovulum sp. PH10]EJW09755.1 Cysteine desulfurase [Rhodovulum sp. PH10]
MTPIYLDHNATTPLDDGVSQAMMPFLTEEFGNPSSAHPLGRRAHQAVERARGEVAALIGAAPEEIVFTSGGTESVNLAIRGAVAMRPERRSIVTTAIEHPVTDACCGLLHAAGFPVRRIGPRRDGRVDAPTVIDALDEATALVSVIHAQNEVGTLQPIADIALVARMRGVVVHADAAQTVGKVPVDVDSLGIDLLSIAGHKLYAPKGIGALYVRRGIALPPLLVGAGQEGGRRPGTENVAGIVGLGAACRIAAERLERDMQRIGELAELLHARLRRAVPDLVLVGHPNVRLPNTLNLLFPGVSGRALLDACPEVIASTGQACHDGGDEPSPVLRMIGYPRELARGAVRLSLGRGTTREGVEIAADRLAAAWANLRRPVVSDPPPVAPEAGDAGGPADTSETPAAPGAPLTGARKS